MEQVGGLSSFSLNVLRRKAHQFQRENSCGTRGRYKIIVQIFSQRISNSLMEKVAISRSLTSQLSVNVRNKHLSNMLRNKISQVLEEYLNGKF